MEGPQTGVPGTRLGGGWFQGGKEEACARCSSLIHRTPALLLPISWLGICDTTHQHRVGEGRELREPEME